MLYQTQAPTGSNIPSTMAGNEGVVCRPAIQVETRPAGHHIRHILRNEARGIVTRSDCTHGGATL